MTATHRLRRCKGDKSAWCLIRLVKGRESTLGMDAATGLCTDGAIAAAVRLRILKPGDVIEWQPAAAVGA